MFYLVCMASLTPSLSASYCACQTDVSTDNTAAIVGGVVAVAVTVYNHSPDCGSDCGSTEEPLHWQVEEIFLS